MRQQTGWTRTCNMTITITIANRSKELHEIFEWRFRELNEVECYFGKFEEVPSFDCVATAGNSFGLMDAGMDLAVVKFFDVKLMQDIQKHILEAYLGEQPVGTAFVQETRDIMHPYVIHAPTMRAPMNINGTDNVYNAMWAVMLEIRRYNLSAKRKIKHLVTTSFGTGTGGMDGLESSLQMMLAIQHYLNPPEYINPSLAQKRYEDVYYGGKWGADHPR